MKHTIDQEAREYFAMMRERNAYRDIIPELVDACADYEVDWFFDREPAEQREVYRHIQLHGFEGFKNLPDHNLFSTCVDKGIFLMEE